MSAAPGEIEALAAAIEDGIAGGVGSGRPEAILREKVEPALEVALIARGARAVGRMEVGLAVPSEAEAEVLDAPLSTSGRADAIYNRFVIEFEPPGALSASVARSGTRHAVAQVQQYLRGLSDRLGIPLDRLAGCAFDGTWIIYITHDGGEWTVLRPRRVDNAALAALVDILVSLASGRGLTADNLYEDFGPGSEAARAVVTEFVAVLVSADRPLRARTFYDQWRLDVGHAAGLPALIDLTDWLELCDDLGVPREHAGNPQVLFALQTYFGIIAKLIALVVLEGATGDELLSGLYDADDVWEGFEALETGVLTASTGALNAVEPGIFSWYLASRSPALADALRRTAAIAAEYSAEVVEITARLARDVLKDLFQKLVPTRLRHRLGEYYTPDWLAEFVLDQVGYDGDPAVRLLDPACGSGTFLVLAIARLRRHLENPERPIAPPREEILHAILTNISGFDVSPLAVMAARANYLIAIRDLLPQASGIEIPVYLCDSVISPSERGAIVAPNVSQAVDLRTGAGVFSIPGEVIQDRETMTTYSTILAASAARGATGEEFLDAAGNLGLPVTDRDGHLALYDQVRQLEAEGADGIWANIIRNSFAPLLQKPVDLIVGNPPWVFWDTLPEGYRERVRDVMTDIYALSSPGSSMARLGSAGKDLSALFVYVSLDRYLTTGGKLGFVITQTLFQSTAGDEFRRFRLPDDTDVRIDAVDDWVSVGPFSSATNKTATFVATKGASTQYPVPYRVWTTTASFDRDSSSLGDVKRATTVEERWAHLSSPQRRTSLWSITPSREAPALVGDVAPNYRPRRGVETGLEAAYRLHVRRVRGSLATVTNIRDRARRPLPAVTAEIEIDRLFPYITGATIRRWNATSPGSYLVPHTPATGMAPIPTSEFARDWPLALAYFERFHDELESRPIHRRWGRDNPFYSLYNIGPYTFAPWKVVWKRTTRNFEAAVVSELPVLGEHNATAIPNGKVMLIGFDEPIEAKYVCGVLNSALARARINASISSEAHAEILQLLRLPRFDGSELHGAIAEAASLCERAASAADVAELSREEAAVDLLVAELWGATTSDLDAAQRAVEPAPRRRRRSA